MKQYNLINNVTGWIVFLIAAVTYCLTVEPSASFWDCPEFTTTATKLEVGHPPGAPFFMLTGNLFTQLTGDPTQAAFMVNIMSALLSALCILFLFWTITHLARMLMSEDGRVASRRSSSWLPARQVLWPTHGATPFGSRLWKVRCMHTPPCSRPSSFGSS